MVYPFGVHRFCFIVHVTTGGKGLLLVVLLSTGFGDAVIYDGASIWFKYEDEFGCC